jgi:CcmD family protein
MKKYLLAGLLIPGIASAQDSMTADLMRSDGKIYVVITVAAIVIAVVGVYMILLDRKISKLEKKIRNKA